MNEFATMIMENRYIATAQLSADDMGSTTWAQYRQLCDNIAISAWKSLRSDADDNIVGLSLVGMIAFLDADFKATTAIQKRLTLACVNIRKKQSKAMKDAREALRDAKKLADKMSDEGEAKTYAETLGEEWTVEKVQNLIKEQVTRAEEKVNELKGTSGNEWYEKTPMLDTTKNHASTKCRKLIEDTLADILAERELMTHEDLVKEALALKAERKARKQYKKEMEKNECHANIMDERKERGEEVAE